MALYVTQHRMPLHLHKQVDRQSLPVITHKRVTEYYCISVIAFGSTFDSHTSRPIWLKEKKKSLTCEGPISPRVKNAWGSEQFESFWRVWRVTLTSLSLLAMSLLVSLNPQPETLQCWGRWSPRLAKLIGLTFFVNFTFSLNLRRRGRGGCTG